MHKDLLDLLACPACADGGGFTVDPEPDNGELEAGTLTCRDCSAAFPIRDGIPRFVDADDDYAGNFSFQWNTWRTLQIDRLSGHSLSEDRFFADSRWPKDGLTGKLVLDAGCGAGRFADIAADHGATVVAVDLSGAVDACRETTADRDGRVHCIQASILDLPLKPGVFDAVYCMGVIQHTPDPEAVMRRLPRHLKPGGRLAYNFYEEGLWRRLQAIKYALRLITPHLSIQTTLAISAFLVGLFYPLTRLLAPIPKVRILNHFIPIAAVHDAQLTPAQQRAWT
ncbi:MAG: methyltransferase domain-containing protein, partial [Rhodospirillaceae bacterium]